MEIITTHKNVDFDALASVFAATKIYSGALAVLPKSLNPNVKAFLSLHKDLFPFKTPNEIDMGEVSRLVVVDAPRWSRLDDLIKLREKADLDIHVWDHHKASGEFGASKTRIEEVGAAVTLLALQLKGDQSPITPIQATLFLAGIYEDTGSMSFSSTTAKDAKAVAFLLEMGGDLTMIKNFLRPAYGPKQKDLLYEMLKTAGREKLDDYNISIGMMEIKGHVPGLSLVVDMYRDIVNVDVAIGIFLEKTRDRCLVIGRSTPDTVDIGAVMQVMGGGGHPSAGSALLRSIGLDDAAAWVSKLLKGNHRTSVKISDLMSYPVFSVSPTTTMNEVALLLRKKGCTGFPVTEGSKVVGIISRRDFRKVRKDAQMKAPVKAFMSTKVQQVDLQSGIVSAVRLMVREDIGRLPVVDEGNLIGILTRSDTMRYYYNLMPD
ncbi:MAG: tRNA nucleotidyl transferase [Desulfobacteraceae bacterium 4572_87]|nr:MAG: tRNA nucleotidyl transferase [Desulfobacteraceae bacterium 4572_87]